MTRCALERTLHRSPAADDDQDGLEEDFEVQSHAPVFDIFRVQLDDFFEVFDLAAAGDLPEAGDAGLGGQSCAVVVGVFLPLVRGGWAGADEGHFAHEDVEELGEFVQGGFADEFADAGLPRAVREDGVPDDAGIPVELEHHAAFNGVLALEALLLLFGVRDHGADLVHSEASHMLSHQLSQMPFHSPCRLQYS